MWETQSQAEAAAEEARDATARAARLLRRAHIAAGAAEDVSDGYNNMSSSAFLHTGPTNPGAGSISKSDDEGESSEEDDESHSGSHDYEMTTAK